MGKYNKFKTDFAHSPKSAALGAHPVKSADPKTQTVAEATAGMTPEQKDAWLNGQIDQTAKDMEAKGIHVDKSKLSPSYFTDDESGDINYNPDNHVIEVSQQSADKMTVAEFRSVLAHETTHSQQTPEQLKEQPGLCEQQGDEAATKTYGAATYNNALAKASGIDLSKPLPVAPPGTQPTDFHKLDPKSTGYDPHSMIGKRMQSNIDYENGLKKQTQTSNTVAIDKHHAHTHTHTHAHAHAHEKKTPTSKRFNAPAV